jgi:hypothetical protein
MNTEVNESNEAAPPAKRLYNAWGWKILLPSLFFGALALLGDNAAHTGLFFMSLPLIGFAFQPYKNAEKQSGVDGNTSIVGWVAIGLFSIMLWTIELKGPRVEQATPPNIEKVCEKLGRETIKSSNGELLCGKSD